MIRWSATLYILLAAGISITAKSSWGSVDILNIHIGTMLSVMATLLGFTVSSTALLYAVADTRLARNLQRTGHFNCLLRSLFQSAFFFFFSVLLGITYLVLPKELTLKGYNILETIGTFFIIIVFISLFQLIPVAKKFWLLLSNIQPENPHTLE